MTSSITPDLNFITVDVFTETRFLGNPLAVVLVPNRLRDSITQETKQRIAREFNLSETVFLHSADDEPGGRDKTRRIDIFTSSEELPFAGHPTIGSAYLVLNHLKWAHVDTLLTKAGPIRIASGGGGLVKADIPHAVHVHSRTPRNLWSASPSEMTKTLGPALSDDPVIRNAELDSRPVSIVRGMTFLLVELPSVEHLGLVTKSNCMDFGTIPGLLDKGEWEGGFVARYYFVPTGFSRSEDGKLEWGIRTRMTELGFEDPATGSAACALASYLTMREKPGNGAAFEITQGVEMGRESQISVEVMPEDVGGGEFRIKDIHLGGKAVVVMSGTVSI